MDKNIQITENHYDSIAATSPDKKVNLKRKSEPVKRLWFPSFSLRDTIKALYLREMFKNISINACCFKNMSTFMVFIVMDTIILLIKKRLAGSV